MRTPAPAPAPSGQAAQEALKPGGHVPSTNRTTYAPACAHPLLSASLVHVILAQAQWWRQLICPCLAAYALARHDAILCWQNISMIVGVYERQAWSAEIEALPWITGMA